LFIMMAWGLCLKTASSVEWTNWKSSGCTKQNYGGWMGDPEWRNHGVPRTRKLGFGIDEYQPWRVKQ
jgi:hypothetical protein